VYFNRLPHNTCIIPLILTIGIPCSYYYIRSIGMGPEIQGEPGAP